MSRPSSEEIARACGGEKRTSNGYDCRCPAHDDKTASLSVNDSGIFHCHAGCAFDDVAAALKSRGITLSNGNGLPPQKVIHYTYSDENGKPLFRKCRQLPKKIWSEGYVDGAWIRKLGSIKRVLYHLPELRAAIKAGKRVAIAEGEKDADRVIKETDGEVVCTTNMAGAGHWPDDHNKEFSGADVTIFYDNDEPGRKHKDKIVTALKSVARKLTVINLPEQYKDVSDFWDAAQDITNDMREVIELPKPLMFDAGEWLESGSYEFDPLVENLFDAGDKVAIIGKAKTRKSFFAMQLLLSAVTGTPMLGFEIPKLRKALLVQYEIKESHFHKRLERTCDALGIAPWQLRGALSIVNARGSDVSREQIADLVAQSGAEIVLFDPIYKLMTEGENAVEDFKPLFQWFDKLSKDTGAAVLYVHHDRKGFTGDQDLSDRGAGSSIVGRDFDAAFFLTPHEDEQLVVLETLTRNYAPTEKQSVQWSDYRFHQSGEPARVKTSRSKDTRNKTTLDDWTEPALAILRAGPLPVAVFLKRLYDSGCDHRSCRATRENLVESKQIEEELILQKKGRPKTFIKLVV